MMIMKEKQLEYRAYFFVPYNISPIQCGIQAKHAFDEYLLKYGRDNPKHIVWDYMKNHKTVIILDGGTTNNRKELGTGISLGSLNQLADFLFQKNIEFSYFEEPDLNDALTAVCFIADERVWNYEGYPDFVDYLIQNELPKRKILTSQEIVEIRMTPLEELQRIDYAIEYHKWINFIGEENVFLRELIRGKKLA